MSQSALPSQPSRPAPAGSFPSARTLFRVRGFPVRVDGSWFLIAGLILFFLYGRMTAVLGGYGLAVVVVAAVVGTLLFFASILAHELGHAWASLDRGIAVSGITLLWMGGVTESREEARTARDEFVIVGIGPFTSLVLAALFGLIMVATQSLPPVSAVADYLAVINFWLAVFNVLPGYPLDGGRILRSILWGVTGRPHQATRWAARVGQVFAAGLATWGAWDILIGTRPGGLSALWLILLGLFLFRGATDSYRRAGLLERLARRTARERMGSVPEALDPDMSLADAIARVQQRPSVLWPVGRPLIGVISLEQFDAVAGAEWPSTHVRDIALPLEGRAIQGDTPMDAAMRALISAPRQMLVVTDDGHAVGLLTPSLVAGG